MSFVNPVLLSTKRNTERRTYQANGTKKIRNETIYKAVCSVFIIIFVTETVVLNIILIINLIQDHL